MADTQSWQKLTDRPGRFWACDFWEASPVRFDDGESHAEEIANIFPGDPLLCLGARSASSPPEPRDAWRGRLSTLPLIVPIQCWQVA